MKATETIVIAVLLVMVSVGTALAGGGGASGGALETTQLQNKAQLVDQLREQVQQTQKLFEQYQNMLQNTLQLPEQVWSQVTGQIEKVKSLFESFQSLNLSAALDWEKWLNAHPGYGKGNSGEKPEDFSKAYKEISNKTNEQAKAILDANDVDQEDIKDGAALSAKLAEAASSTEGQHQAIQASAAILSEINNNTLKLRQAIDRQLETTAVTEKLEQDEKDAKREAVDNFIGERPAHQKGKNHADQIKNAFPDRGWN